MGTTISLLCPALYAAIVKADVEASKQPATCARVGRQLVRLAAVPAPGVALATAGHWHTRLKCNMLPGVSLGAV